MPSTPPLALSFVLVWLICFREFCTFDPIQVSDMDLALALVEEDL
jgi:hypothetical protein